MPTLDDEARSTLEAELTLEELQTAMNQLPLGKVPGSDGFPTEYLRGCFPLLRQQLLRVFLEAKERGVLPPTMREGMISLILKKDADPADPASYRPITVINADVKLLCKTLAVRLSGVISQLVHEDQCGFIHKRNTAMNLRRLNYVMHETAGSKEKLTVASIDISKAFDTVDWAYLLETLARMGVGPEFRA